MRLFALKDSTDPDAVTIAVLCCYEAEREYYIDMPAGTDPWTVPFVLSSFATRGRWAVPPDWSRRWVESRLVPQSRQNLGEVLKENNLESYDTLRLLELTDGRNSQDDCYLERIDLVTAPKWFRERESKRIVEAVPLGAYRLLVAFRTGEVRVCDAHDFEVKVPGIERVLAKPDLFDRCEMALGGRGVRWGSSIWISDERLRIAGQAIGLTWDDLARIAPALLLDTAETSQILDCTRQNVSALAKRGSLTPVKSGGKSTLFIRADVNARAAGLVSYGHVRLS